MKAVNKSRWHILWALLFLIMLYAICSPGVKSKQQWGNDACAFMKTIVLSLNDYRAAKGTYPPSPDWCMESWLSRGPSVFYCSSLGSFEPAGPKAFSGGAAVLHYRYTYSASDAEHFTLRALPDVRSAAGWITYYADESGRIHHCILQSGNETADTSDSEITKVPSPCSNARASR